VKYHWKLVDWVELGCRGWEIEEDGALLYEGYDMNHAHLDWSTGHLILSGFPGFVRRVISDLEAAGLPDIAIRWAVTATTGTATWIPARPL
jgi:hypothetical protein